MYNIKGYTNADNDINEAKPSIELLSKLTFKAKILHTFMKLSTIM